MKLFSGSKAAQAGYIALAALFIFAFILPTLPPTVFYGDNGETITCAYTLGIQHPPGYPLFTMAAKIFTLPPFGDPSFRVYLFSLFLLILCFPVFILFSLEALLLLGIKKHAFLIALMASLLFSTGYYIWEQASLAKGGIYLLNIFFTLCISYLLLRFSNKTADFKHFYAAVFLLSLSLANHHMTQLVLLPAYVFLFISSGFYKKLRLAQWASAAVIFLIGLTPYLFMLLRARTAIINWGEPSDLAALFDMLARRQYSAGEITRSFAASFAQAQKFFSCMGAESFAAGALFSLCGFYFIFHRDKKLFIFLLSIPALFFLAVTLYLNLTPERLYVMETYVTPVYFVLAFTACFGVYSLAALLRGKGPVLFTGALVTLIFFQLLMFYPKMDKSRYFYARDFSLNILRSVDNDAILFSNGDAVVFPLWYLKYVKQYGKDITLIGSAVLPMRWVRDNIVRQNISINLPQEAWENKMGTESVGPLIKMISRLNIKFRPIYFSYNIPEKGAIDESVRLMPKGTVFRVVPAPYAKIDTNYLGINTVLWQLYCMRGVFDRTDFLTDSKTKELFIGDYAVMANSLGTFYEEAGFFAEALKYYAMAHVINPASPIFPFNMGNAFYNMSDYKSALVHYKRSLEADAAYEEAWNNLAVTYMELKDRVNTLVCLEKLKQLNPARPGIDGMIEKLKAGR